METRTFVVKAVLCFFFRMRHKHGHSDMQLQAWLIDYYGSKQASISIRTSA